MGILMLMAMAAPSAHAALLEYFDFENTTAAALFPDYGLFLIWRHKHNRADGRYSELRSAERRHRRTLPITRVQHDGGGWNLYLFRRDHLYTKCEYLYYFHHPQSRPSYR